MLGFAIVASTIANANRGKGQRPYEVKDFMPDFEKLTKTQTTDEMIQFAEMMTIAMGGKDLRKKKK